MDIYSVMSSIVDSLSWLSLSPGLFQSFKVSKRPLKMTRKSTVLRRCVLISAPILLTATFALNEVALVWGDTEFAVSYRRFVYASLFYPFALGVLLGHWFHMLGGGFRIDRRRFGKPLVQALIGAFIILSVAVVGIVSFGRGVSIPLYVSTVMSVIGVVFGMLVWPVRVYHG